MMRSEERRRRGKESGWKAGRTVVAILTNYPLREGQFSAGVETAAAGLLEGLREFVEEFDFHVFALTKASATPLVKVRDEVTFHFIPVPMQWYARPRLIPNIIRARQELSRLKPDIIHCQDNMALAMSALLTPHPRKVFTVHGIKHLESEVWEGPEYWSLKMDALLERLVRSHFSRVVTISPFVDQFLPAKVTKHHISNCIQDLFFKNPQRGEHQGRFLFVGSLTRLKRPHDIIEAISLLDDHQKVRLSIIGPVEDRKYLNEMERRCVDQNLEGVEFLGLRSQQEVAAYMRSSTALILPSAHENSPMVIAEAMASGLPVVASRVGGVPYMIEDGVDGLMFDCSDTNQLAALLDRLLKDTALRSSLSLAGRTKAEKDFTSEAVANATVEMYRHILSH